MALEWPPVPGNTRRAMPAAKPPQNASKYFQRGTWKNVSDLSAELPAK